MQNPTGISISYALPEISGYTVHERIGEGGYGNIYRATQCSTGQEVAIKLLKQKTEPDSRKWRSQVLRFERETRL